MNPVMLSVIGVMLLAGLVCLRLSEWSQYESDYWYDVHRKVLLRPELDAQYQPLLAWVKANRPSLLRRLVGWSSPDVRAGWGITE